LFISSYMLKTKLFKSYYKLCQDGTTTFWHPNCGILYGVENKFQGCNALAFLCLEWNEGTKHN
jgi:hypothetical protein